MPSLNYDSGFSWIKFDDEEGAGSLQAAACTEKGHLGEDLETINRVYGDDFIGVAELR